MACTCGFGEITLGIWMIAMAIMSLAMAYQIWKDR